MSAHHAPPQGGPGETIDLITGDRLQPFLQGMRHSIAYRAFELWDGRGRRHGDDLSDWFRAEEELTSRLRPEVSEHGGSVVLKIDLPDLKQDEVALALEPRRVILRLTRHGESLHPHETFGIGDLPVEVDTSSAQAVVHNGILQLRAGRKDR